MSGNSERPLWICSKCGKRYYELMLQEEKYTFSAVIMLDDGIPVLYYFKKSIFIDIPEYLFEEQYARTLHCFECNTHIDGRTKEWKNIRKMVLEAFRNRREFNERE